MENEAGNKIKPDKKVNTQSTEKNRVKNESKARIEFTNKMSLKKRLS